MSLVSSNSCPPKEMKDSQLKTLRDCILMADASLVLELPTQCRHFAQATYHAVALRPFTSSLESDLVLPATCTFLATKSEEKSRPLKQIVSVFAKLAGEKSAANRRNGLSLVESKVELTEAYILSAEIHILKAIGFRLYDYRKQNPSGLAVQIVRAVEPAEQRRAQLLKAAWRFMNDAYFFSLSVTVEPLLLAVAGVFLGARVCHLKYVTTRNPWWLSFGVNTVDLEGIVNMLLHFYARFDEKIDLKN